MSDKQLRARVKLLGKLLGNVLRAQAGGHVYAAVENLRRGYISLQEKDSPHKRARLVQLISKLDPDTLSHVVRAGGAGGGRGGRAGGAARRRRRRRGGGRGGPRGGGAGGRAGRRGRARGGGAGRGQAL